jgi:sortase B
MRKKYAIALSAFLLACLGGLYLFGLRQQALPDNITEHKFHHIKPPHLNPYINEARQNTPQEIPSPHEEEPTPALEPAPHLPRVVRDEFILLREAYNNGHIIGHLTIPGTNIDYLVVHTVDNEFYLTHDLHGSYDRAGTIFMDFTNSLHRPDRNTVLYGHNMAAGTHFGTLTRFRNADFFRENRYIYFNTLYEDTKWEIFAFYSTDISFNYIQVIFPFADAFEQMLQEIKRLSWHDAGIEVTADDRILTLSTCSAAGQNIRYVLHARLY